jgi:hypothetical protein
LYFATEDFAADYFSEDLLRDDIGCTAMWSTLGEFFEN